MAEYLKKAGPNVRKKTERPMWLLVDFWEAWEHGRDARATRSHGLAARATFQTHGQDARATLAVAWA